MLLVLLPLAFAQNPFMGSQSGNLSDLSAYSGNTTIVPEAESDSNLRHDYLHAPSLNQDMGLRYLAIPTTDDMRITPDTDTNSPVYSVDCTTQQPLALSYPPYTDNYHQGALTGSTTYSNGSTSLYSPATSLYSMPDIKPRLSSFSASSPGMSRSPALPHLGSPIATRDLYASATPNYRRGSDLLLSRSPALGSVRGAPLSPSESRSGFTSPTSMDSTLHISGEGSPPLRPTHVMHQFQTVDGQIIRPEIYGKIDKGFFIADNDWTCYRRNYFALQCSYTLLPHIPNGPLHLVQSGGHSPSILGFAISISAVVDGQHGKVIELVQHTPKRDKGPQLKPERIPIAPKQPQLGIFGDGGLGNSSRSLFDQSFGPNPGQTATEATFERIQFKNATANNGKRRAAQQYYHLVIELFADLGSHHSSHDRWVKVATRMSAPMVVRGRSPGHYQSERRESNASIGPGGSGAGGSGTFSPGGSLRVGDLGTVSSTMLNSSSYGSNYDPRSHHYSRLMDLRIPMDPTVSSEDTRDFCEHDGFLYYPSPMNEGQERRYPLPRVTEEPRIKSEFSQNNGYSLPSLTSGIDSLPRHCGRWEGVQGSSAYFPSVTLQHEMSI
ncbi:putative ndt80 like DNA-binding family protein [Coleophoma crateriformis]|uniref:Putative ndt80 like DNA-binding family protein n=1 Tax=Coleophoma crateriformis TaxID=565419 RepID=A0A3D8SXM5_9HELO|nr:putative ndt80 like DNA-binding family protein [Coleophoma crateriformis]